MKFKKKEKENKLKPKNKVTNEDNSLRFVIMYTENNNKQTNKNTPCVVSRFRKGASAIPVCRDTRLTMAIEQGETLIYRKRRADGRYQ